MQFLLAKTGGIPYNANRKFLWLIGSSGANTHSPKLSCLLFFCFQIPFYATSNIIFQRNTIRETKDF
nr:MAG TPA: hypothetical protein [Caudoviricetes sp.]DAL63501.1 MAG TPA_asm: hypothetical protein [Caudoviricetes sp.]